MKFSQPARVLPLTQNDLLLSMLFPQAKHLGYSFLFFFALLNFEGSGQEISKHGPSEVYSITDIIEAKDGRLFLSSAGGIYYSDDLGDRWHKVDAWLNTVYLHPNFSVNNDNGELYAWDRQQGIYSTNDNGTTWEYELAILPQGSNVTALAIDGDTLFIGTMNGLYYVQGPEVVRNAIPLEPFVNREITALHVDSKLIICGTRSDGIFMSEDLGKTWASRSSGLPVGFNVKGITVAGPTIYAYSDWMGVYYSNDDGISWTEKNEGFAVKQVNKLFVDGDILYAATNSYFNIYRSDLGNAGWTLIDQGIPNGSLPVTLYASGNDILVGAWFGVYKSKNAGASFEPSYEGITDAFVFRNMEVSSDGTIWAVGSHTGIYKMEPLESTFTPVVRENGGVNYGSASLMGDILPIVTDYRVRMYNVVEQKWEAEELTYTNFIFGDRLIKSDGNFFLSSKTNGIFKYTGTSLWEEFNAGLESLSVTDFVYVNGRFIVATDDGLFSRATGDNQFERISFSSTNQGVRSFFSQGSLYLISANDNNTYLSNDYGEHWQIVEELEGLNASCYTSSGGILYAASFTKLFISSDNGLSWSSRNLPSVWINSMTVSQGRLFLGTLEHGIWSTSAKFNQQVSFLDLPETVFSGTEYTLAASSTSGLPVTFTVLSGPGAVIGNKLSVLGEGEIVVSAIQQGNEIYSPFSIERTLRSENVTGIAGETGSTFIVFPNPASSEIHVTSDNFPSSGSIRLVSLQGTAVMSGIAFTGETIIPVSDLPRGMYFLQFTDGKKTKTEKIVVK